jgi:hypothetical protein
MLHNARKCSFWSIMLGKNARFSPICLKIKVNFDEFCAEFPDILPCRKWSISLEKNFEFPRDFARNAVNSQGILLENEKCSGNARKCSKMLKNARDGRKCRVACRHLAPRAIVRVLLFLPLGKKGKFLLGKGEVGRFSQI